MLLGVAHAREALAQAWPALSYSRHGVLLAPPAMLGGLLAAGLL